MRGKISTGLVALALAMGQPAAAQVAGQPAQTTPPAAQAAPDIALREGVLVTVNDDLISSFDLRQQMLMLMFRSGMQPTSEEDLQVIQQGALNNAIETALKLQEMEHWEVEVTDAMVDAEIASTAQRAGATAATLVSQMASVGIRPETYREDVRANIGWRMLVGGRYGNRARVSSDQINAVLARVTNAAARHQWLLGEIYIDAAEVGGQDRAMAGARQLVQQIMSGGPGVFQAVARQFSRAPSADSGGDAGWVIEGDSPAAVQTVLDQMDPGQLSNPIPVDGGVYIILVRDERNGGITNMADIRQAAIRLDPTATQAQVDAAAATLNQLNNGLTCDNIVQRANATPGVVGAALGEANPDDLAAAFQQVARTAPVGSINGPLRSEQGLHLVAVCGRRATAADVPSRDEIEGELFDQQINMLARRYMRDLRTAATIESRGGG